MLDKAGSGALAWTAINASPFTRSPFGSSSKRTRPSQSSTSRGSSTSSQVLRSPSQLTSQNCCNINGEFLDRSSASPSLWRRWSGPVRGFSLDSRYMLLSGICRDGQRTLDLRRDFFPSRIGWRTQPLQVELRHANEREFRAFIGMMQNHVEDIHGQLTFSFPPTVHEISEGME
jgi:hypothetical protein